MKSLLFALLLPAFGYGQTIFENIIAQPLGPHRHIVNIDHNNDGFEDIITSNGAGVFLIPNHLNQHFDAPIMLSDNRDVFEFKFVDINNDGLNEIVTNDHGSILEYDGESYNLVVTLFQVRLSDIAYIDLNSDDLPDVVFYDEPNNSISVKMNMGNFKFGPDMLLTNEAAIGFRNMFHEMDINNDNLVDLVYTSIFGPEIAVLYNSGNGNFLSKTPDILSSRNAFSIYQVDMDSDGHKDLVCGGTASPAIYILFNNGNNTYEEVKIKDFITRDYTFTIGNLNEDNNLDIFVNTDDTYISVMNQLGRSFRVTENSHERTTNPLCSSISTPTKTKLPLATGPLEYELLFAEKVNGSQDVSMKRVYHSSAKIADSYINDMGLYVISKQDNILSYYEKNSSGIHSNAEIIFASTIPWISFNLIDVNKDNLEDIVFTGFSSKVGVYIAQDKLRYPDPPEFIDVASFNGKIIAQIDIHSDGDQDLILNDFTWLENDNDFLTYHNEKIIDGSSISNILIKDLDGDGSEDILEVINSSSAPSEFYFYFWENGTFAKYLKPLTSIKWPIGPCDFKNLDDDPEMEGILFKYPYIYLIDDILGNITTAKLDSINYFPDEINIVSFFNTEVNDLLVKDSRDLFIFQDICNPNSSKTKVNRIPLGPFYEILINEINSDKVDDIIYVEETGRIIAFSSSDNITSTYFALDSKKNETPLHLYPSPNRGNEFYLTLPHTSSQYELQLFSMDGHRVPIHTSGPSNQVLITTTLNLKGTYILMYYDQNTGTIQSGKITFQ